jgi:L-threonylcarbamoyladenylate synthase
VIEELDQYLSMDDRVLDGGPCSVGVESTIIDCTGNAPKVLRPGAISNVMIEESTGLKITESDFVIRVSGSLDNHYSPAAKVLLHETPVQGQGFIANANIQTPPGVIRLASPESDEAFAQILYSALRLGDAQGLSEVVVVPPTGFGLAVAIRDRLTKAARKKTY